MSDDVPILGRCLVLTGKAPSKGQSKSTFVNRKARDSYNQECYARLDAHLADKAAFEEEIRSVVETIGSKHAEALLERWIQDWLLVAEGIAENVYPATKGGGA